MLWTRAQHGCRRLVERGVSWGDLVFAVPGEEGASAESQRVGVEGSEEAGEDSWPGEADVGSRKSR